MCDFVTARARWLKVNWFWPLALLTLPSCGLDVRGSGVATSFNANPGPTPNSGAVFCDIEKPSGRHCASDEEINTLGIRLAAGAEALVVGEKSSIGLDYSAAALSACGGKPQAVEFEGQFPDGTPVCVNCGAVAPDVASAGNLCVARCEDLTQPNHVPADPGVAADCANRAHLSINAASPTFCFGGACSDVGQYSEAFVSNRRNPEPVQWVNQTGVLTSGADNNTLKRNAATSGSFDAGASSGPTQLIEKGDGYVEFTATGTSQTRVAGLSQGASDPNANFTSIDFGISLFKEGCFYVFEAGAQVNGTIETCTAPHAFGGYLSGNTFRVAVKDNFDGTATVSYIQVTPDCKNQVKCDPFYTSVKKLAYPFRVDTSFREVDGILGDVVLVRIR